MLDRVAETKVCLPAVGYPAVGWLQSHFSRYNSDMHITRIYVDGFKRLTNFTLELNEKLNVIVGDNETG